jgi:hypothetical protein
MRSEERNFTVHPHILYSIIQNQAGTLAKALLEGVMNSIDAGASRISVQLDNEGFSLNDDGRGFQSREEILNWFEQFGTPHEEGDAIYGRFRMGRGMLMAFAVNTWRTGVFQMDVDIKGRGLDYKLTEKRYAVKGCRVDGKLYESLSQSALDEVVTEFTALVRYAQIPVVLNGRVISKQPELQSWDMVTDDAYIKTTRTGDLMVYNLGVLVRSYPQWHFGCGGVAVTKESLEVNFARNDIITHKCKVWRRISEHLKSINLKKIASKGSLNSEERDFLARQWAFGDVSRAEGIPLLELKLFTDAGGRHHSCRELLASSKVSVARDVQARTGARLHREGKAFVLSEDTLQRFRVDSVESLLQLLEEKTGYSITAETVDFEALALGCEETYQVHDDTELTLSEFCALSALKARHEKFYQWFSRSEKCSGLRELKAGSSDVASAWTDGASYVVINRQLLAKAAEKGEAGFFELVVTLVHEYCHDTADLESHSHDQVFYTKHHDLIQYRGGKLMQMVKDMAAHYVRLARKAGVSVPVKAATVKSRTTQRAVSTSEVFAKSQLPLFE